MNKNYSKTLSLIMIIAILFSFHIPVQADIGGGGEEKGALSPIYDNSSHGALQWRVKGVTSTSPLQAFVIGWNFTFKGDNGQTLTIYIPRKMDYWGAHPPANVYPLTNGWSSSTAMHGIDNTGAYAGKTCIRDFINYEPNKVKFDNIVSKGCTITANAKIQKYTYDTDRKPEFIAISSSNPTNIATTYDELKNNFKEFSSEYLINMVNYFNITFRIEPEKIPPQTPKVALTQPKNGTTILQGTTVTFKGTGTGCHHIGGFVDGKFYGVEQYNKNDDIASEMIYETTIRLDEAKDYAFQLKGRNTGQERDEGSVLAESAIHTVHVIAPLPDSGSINIRCIDYDTEKEIKDTSQAIPGVKYGQARTIDISSLDQSILSNYEFKGSSQNHSDAIPDKSKLTANKSQTATLSSTNKTAYIYFWFKQKEVKPPVPTSKPPTAILNNTAVAYAGDDVSFDGSQSYDTDGTITGYSWSLPGASENNAGSDSGGKTWYDKEGTYSIGLTITDDSGLTASASGNVKILPPKPNVILNVSAAKLKENRKIALDLSDSTSPGRYPIDWSLAAWSIEVVKGSGATGDYGVRLENGKVYKNSEGKAQLYESGKWKATGLDFNSILTGQKTIQFQARDSGQYKITATITNTASFDSSLHYSNSSIKTINIVEDLAPDADFSAPDSNVREQDSPEGSLKQKYGIIPVTCTTVSPDGDPIGVRRWSVRYDSNNNGSFADEKTIYPYTGYDPFKGGLRLVAKGDSAAVCEVWSYEVGSYTEALEAFEAIPEDEAVVELLTFEDYRSDYAQGW
jgi:outer membrane lipoprotein-sorting protein